MSKKQIIVLSHIYGKSYCLKINMCLCQLKGNELPYFSVTGDAYTITGRPGRRPLFCSGTISDMLPKSYDDLKKLVNCDINGRPMYTIENGCYFLENDLQAAARHFRAPAWEIELLKNIYNNHGAAGVELYLQQNKYKQWKADAIAVIKKYNLQIVRG